MKDVERKKERYINREREEICREKEGEKEI
jgi:hypothetical protein